MTHARSARYSPAGLIMLTLCAFSISMCDKNTLIQAQLRFANIVGRSAVDRQMGYTVFPD